MEVFPATKRFLIILAFLILMSGLAHANWEKIGAYGDGSGTVYVDPDTIRRKENLVKMWLLYDFNTVRTVAGTSHLSAKN